MIAAPADARHARFRLAVDDARLSHVLARLSGATWPVMPDNPPGHDGVDPMLVRQFVDHVTGKDYDWRVQEAAINALPSFVADIDGYQIQFLHVAGSAPRPRPLLLCHGWPGGMLEFVDLAERLAHPERFGGAVEDAWTLVIPTLPGYGLSSPPPRPIGPRSIARLFDRLMREELGYESYVAQGGDWGSVVASWLGYESPACRAIHLNFHLGWAMGHERPATPEELAAGQHNAQFMACEGAYIGLQSTKPLTLSYAMADSPLGAAAWIIEKFASWSDLRTASLWEHFDRDRLATLIMAYLLTDAFGTASWLYRGLLGTEERPDPDARVARPTGIAVYPCEIGGWPRTMVERRYDVVHWAEQPRGGHFAAFEQPALFAEDLIAFGRAVG